MSAIHVSPLADLSTRVTIAGMKASSRIVVSMYSQAYPNAASLSAKCRARALFPSAFAFDDVLLEKIDFSALNTVPPGFDTYQLNFCLLGILPRPPQFTNSLLTPRDGRR